MLVKHNTLQGLRAIFNMHFQVGIFKDGKRRKVTNRTKSFAKGPARQASAKTSPVSQVELMHILKKKGLDILGAPFKEKNALYKDRLDIYMMGYFMKKNDRAVLNRLLNALAGIPKQYMGDSKFGTNKAGRRYGIDSGQLYKAIKARVVKNGIS